MEVRGLSCPSCGGAVPLTEGARLATCPACGTALLAQGDLGHATYAVSLQAPREKVLKTLGKWWGEMDKAKDLAATARVTESFPVFVPVWRVRGQVVGWVLGEERREKNDKTTYVPVERRVLLSCDVNQAACDLGDLGIRSVGLASDLVEPLDEEKVEAQGMIFRPLVPASEGRAFAEARFLEQARAAAKVDRVTQAFLNVVGVSQSLVYAPLWIVRYEYRQRMYQATADGTTGRLLFARAPGNDLFRVAAFLFGIAGGSFLLTSVLRSLPFDELAPYVVVAVVSAAMMFWGYRRLRYGAEVTIGGDGPGAETIVDAVSAAMGKVRG